MKYIGQTGRSFVVRYKEHFHGFIYKNGNSKFAQHLSDYGRSFRPIENIIDVLHVERLMDD